MDYKVLILFLLFTSCQSTPSNETKKTKKESLVNEHQPDWKLIKEKRIVSIDTTEHFFQIFYIEDDRSAKDYETVMTLEKPMT